MAVDDGVRVVFCTWFFRPQSPDVDGFLRIYQEQEFRRQFGTVGGVLTTMTAAAKLGLIILNSTY